MSNNFSHGGDPGDDGDFSEVQVTPEFLKLLEATVLAAGTYVVPSDNLRPHTLEAARELDLDRKGTYAIAKVLLAIAVCGCVCLPVVERLAVWRDKVEQPTSVQIHKTALKKNIGIDWGLFEAFSELKQSQASRFGSAAENKVRDSSQY